MAFKRWVLWGALIAGAVCILGVIGQGPLLVEGDTDYLLRGTEQLLQCLRQGQSGACEGANKFPPLQMLIAAVALQWGATLNEAGRLLAIISELSFVGLFIIVLVVFWRRAPRWVAPLCTVLISSPFLWYARRSFGETLAAALSFLFVAALLTQRWRLAGVFACLVGLGKETAPPFLVSTLAIALAAQAVESGDPLAQLIVKRWRAIVWPVLGTAMGALGCLGLNLIRFGSPFNRFYVEESMWTPAIRHQASQFLALWLAPAGGVLWVWPSLIIAWLTLVGLAMRHRKGRVLFLTAATTAALTFGLSRWWSCFGWWAWGPRLLIPWLPAWLGALTWAYGTLGKQATTRPAWSPLLRAGLAVGAAVTALPSMVQSLDVNRVARFFVSNPSMQCADPRQVPIDTFSECITHAMWTQSDIASSLITAATVPVVLWSAIAFSLSAGVISFSLDHLVMAEPLVVDDQKRID